MQVKKIENEKAVAYVYYNTPPTKEHLEKACMLFMQKAIQELEKKGKNPYGK